MGKERREKSILVGVLCAVILFMAIGFAGIGSQLKIEGEASIGDTWNVQITGIAKKEASDGVVETATYPNFTANSANFNVQLSQPGDYAIYTVTVKNLGTIDAVLNVLTEFEQATTGDNAGSPAIEYTLLTDSSNAQGETLANTSGVHTFDIKVEYLSTAVGTNAPTQGAARSYTLTLDYAQDTSAGA